MNKEIQRFKNSNSAFYTKLNRNFCELFKVDSNFEISLPCCFSKF